MTNVHGGIPPARRYGVTLVLSALLGWGCGGDGNSPPASPVNPPPGTATGADGGAPVTVPPGGGRDGGTRDTPAGTPSPFDGGQSGTAVAKFCNTLVLASGASLNLELAIGTPPVVLVAGSGKCTPPVGQPCTTIPAGNVMVALSRDGMPLGMGGFVIPAGQDVVFETELNGNAVNLVGSVLQPGTCPEIDLVDVPDGGAPPPSPDAAGGMRPGL